MNHEIITPLIPFLGACIYGDAEKFYAGLDLSDQKELETQALRDYCLIVAALESKSSRETNCLLK